MGEGNTVQSNGRRSRFAVRESGTSTVSLKRQMRCQMQGAPTCDARVCTAESGGAAPGVPIVARARAAALTSELRDVVRILYVRKVRCLCRVPSSFLRHDAIHVTEKRESAHRTPLRDRIWSREDGGGAARTDGGGRAGGAANSEARRASRERGSTVVTPWIELRVRVLVPLDASLRKSH